MRKTLKRLSRYFVCDTADCTREVTTEWYQEDNDHWTQNEYLCTECSDKRRKRFQAHG